MKLFLVDLGDEQQNMTEVSRERCLQMVRNERLQKVQKMKNQKNQNESLIAGMLLNVATGLHEKKAENLQTQECESSKSEDMEIVSLTVKQLIDLYSTQYDYELTTENNGKPIYKHKPDLFFNLSHSGNVVVCAIGSSPVGIDVEGNRNIRLNTAKRFFTEAEYRWVGEGQLGRGEESVITAESDEQQACSENPTIEQKKRFLRIWTLKEAYSKLTGEGIAYGISQVQFLPDSRGNMHMSYVDKSLHEEEKLMSLKEIKIREYEYKGYRIAVIER